MKFANDGYYETKKKDIREANKKNKVLKYLREKTIMEDGMSKSQKKPFSSSIFKKSRIT